MDTKRRNSTRSKRARSVKRTSPPRRPPARKRKQFTPADTHPVLAAFQDALALITVSHSAIAQSDLLGPAETALDMGVKALKAACDRLETFDIELWHWAKKCCRRCGRHS